MPYKFHHHPVLSFNDGLVIIVDCSFDFFFLIHKHDLFYLLFDPLLFFYEPDRLSESTWNSSVLFFYNLCYFLSKYKMKLYVLPWYNIIDGFIKIMKL